MNKYKYIECCACGVDEIMGRNYREHVEEITGHKNWTCCDTLLHLSEH